MRSAGRQEGFILPGDRPFRVSGYSTPDALEDLLRPGSFTAGGQRVELIYAGMQPRPLGRRGLVGVMRSHALV